MTLASRRNKHGCSESRFGTCGRLASRNSLVAQVELGQGGCLEARKGRPRTAGNALEQVNRRSPSASEPATSRASSTGSSRASRPCRSTVTRFSLLLAKRFRHCSSAGPQETSKPRQLTMMDVPGTLDVLGGSVGLIDQLVSFVESEFNNIETDHGTKFQWCGRLADRTTLETLKAFSRGWLICFALDKLLSDGGSRPSEHASTRDSIGYPWCCGPQLSSFGGKRDVSAVNGCRV